jgi:hypothetical protein
MASTSISARAIIVDELQQDWSHYFAKLADAILQRLVPRLCGHFEPSPAPDV